MLLNATGQVCAFLRMLRYQVGSQTFTVGVVFYLEYHVVITGIDARLLLCHNGMRGENVIYFTAASLMCLGFYYRQ